MPARSTITPVLKASFLLVFAAILFLIWHWRVWAPVAVQDEDDLKYTPRVTVHVGTIALATMHQYLTAFGVVEPAPARVDAPAAVGDITVPTPSQVSTVNCVEGQHVEKGQPLFTLDTPSKGPSTILSPLDGTVVRLAIHAGEIARPKVTAILIVDLNRLVIAVNIPADQLSALKLGQPVQFISDQPPDTTQPSTAPSPSTGIITYIDPAIDPATAMGSLDVSVPSTSHFRLGQFVQAQIIIAEHRDCLTVPIESIVNDSQGRPSISLAVRDFRWAIRQPVELGLREGNTIEIRSQDLRAGQSIITTGAYALPDKSTIEVEKQ